MKSKLIKSFLKNLSDEEFRFLRIQISMAQDARNLIATFGVEPKDFCNRLNFPIEDYDALIKMLDEYGKICEVPQDSTIDKVKELRNDIDAQIQTLDIVDDSDMIQGYGYISGRITEIITKNE